VLIWTVGQHTYAFGFHDVSTIRRTLALDVTLGRNLTLIAPSYASGPTGGNTVACAACASVPQ